MRRNYPAHGPGASPEFLPRVFVGGSNRIVGSRRIAVVSAGPAVASRAGPCAPSPLPYGSSPKRSAVAPPAHRATLAHMLTLESLEQLLQAHREAAAAPVREFRLGSHHLAFNQRKAIMGVVNLSPDSWYRESVCLDTESALRRGRVLAAQGADLVDVGAESTLSHAARLDDALQNSKLLPVVCGLRAEGIPVSVETYQPEVARACLEAGASVLNLTGAAGSESMYRLVADHDAAVIICYIQGSNVREVGEFDFGTDPVAGMREYFAREIELATSCGVERIFIDPGLGFYYRNLKDSAARVRHQISTFLNTFRLRSLGWPVCHALPHAFEFFGDEVRCAEPFFAVLAALGKTDLFRTHEVPRVRSVLDTLAIVQGGGASDR
jgi:dihydropteroate synthase